MTNIREEENVRSYRSKMRRLFAEAHSCLAHPLTRDDDDQDDVLNGVGILSRTIHAYTYRKLPQQLIKLSILKLDGSIFEVQIARNATVAELKLAIEDIFTSDNISWSHVWGHFCLCYDDHKLINDRASLQIYGIKDVDQLHFMHHLSINYSPLKRHYRNQLVSGDKNWRLQEGTDNFDIGLSSTSNDLENEKEHSSSDDDSHTEDQYNAYNLGCGCNKLKQEEIPITQFKMTHSLRGRPLYSKLWHILKRGLCNRNHPSLYSSRIVPRMLQL